MILKRIFTMLLLICLVFINACGNTQDLENNVSSTPTDDTTETLTVISVLYSSNDSLDPYKAETELNRRLSSLMFDPLVKLNTVLQPEKVLAKDIQLNGKECIVTLKNAYFSDGTPVTAEDVEFSLNKALKATLTVYPKQLSSIKSYEPISSDTLKIELKKADSYFINLLDFPIIKKDSDKLYDENKIELPPIGSGRFVFDNSTKQLDANTTYICGKPTIETVKLINAPDDAVINYNLEVGNVSIFNTDLNDGIIPPMSGTTSTVELNQLVYIGINLNNEYLKIPEIRYALASGIDRNAICNDAFYSYAKPSEGLFSSAWEDTGKLQNLKQSADLQNVIANLDEIGYNNKDEDGFFTDQNGKTIELRLLTYKDNTSRNNAAKLISEQLIDSGFKIKLIESDWDSYVQTLTKGDFDLYLAETKLLNNMDVSQLVTTGGNLSYGIPKSTTETETSDQADNNITINENNDKTDNETVQPQKPTSYVPLLDNTVNGFYNAEYSLVDIINAFNAEMPIIPVCHRLGLTVYDSKLNISEMSSVSDVFFGIKNN